MVTQQCSTFDGPSSLPASSHHCWSSLQPIPAGSQQGRRQSHQGVINWRRKIVWWQPSNWEPDNPQIGTPSLGFSLLIERHRGTGRPCDTQPTKLGTSRNLYFDQLTGKYLQHICNIFDQLTGKYLQHICNIIDQLMRTYLQTCKSSHQTSPVLQKKRSKGGAAATRRIRAAENCQDLSAKRG